MSSASRSRVKMVAVILAVLGVAGAGVPSKGPGGDYRGAAPPAHTDLHGDPLPPAALARMGTTRLREPGPVVALAFSQDGKTLSSAGMFGSAHRWEVSTGKELQ